jgi:hypothetical protein
MILGFIISVQGGKPANARLAAAAIPAFAKHMRMRRRGPISPPSWPL